MRTRRLWIGLLWTVGIAGGPTRGSAQALGPEFQVNTYTTSTQRTGYYVGRRLVTADASGNFVVVWESLGQDGGNFGVFGQRYDSGGVAQGAEFRVNSYTTANQYHPSIASDASGNFVVVWNSNGQDGSLDGIFGQRYNSSGLPQGDEFRVNSFTTGRQNLPSVASDTSGNLLVAWVSNDQDGSQTGVFGQRYDSAGVAQGGEFRVNTYTTSYQSRPSIAFDASGNFVVVWSSSTQDGSSFGIFGQRFDNGGEPRGGEFRVNSYTTGFQSRPSVASDADGNFVVAWNGSAAQDGDSYGIFAQRYDSEGVAQGGEFQVNSYTTSVQGVPSVASDASGNFVVVWESLSNQDGGGPFGIFGQRYDSAGAAQGDEFLVNSYTPFAQRFPSAAATTMSQFVVTWESESQDGSGYGVFGQRFDFSGLPSLSISDVSVTEGNLPGRAAGVWAVFTVTLSEPSAQPVTIDYTTANGTATAPLDYKAKSGTLTLSAGQTSSRIAVMVRVDNVLENDETFFVNLSNPTNATIADGHGVGTIVNDDL